MRKNACKDKKLHKKREARKRKRLLKTNSRRNESRDGECILQQIKADYNAERLYIQTEKNENGETVHHLTSDPFVPLNEDGSMRIWLETDPQVVTATAFSWNEIVGMMNPPLQSDD